MMKFTRMTFLSVAATGLVLTASASWAASTIKVVESGEGGGAMSMKLDPATVPAGDVVFKVHNDALTEEHEMVVVKLKSADEKIAVEAASNRVDEDKLESLGEVSELKPGEDGELKTTLQPGNYLVFCNLKGHFEAGMQTTLTVTP